MVQKQEADVDPVPDPQNRHLAGLLKDLVGGLLSLVKMEIALAKAEMKEKAVSMALGSVLLIVAAFFALLALGVMTATIIIAISVALPAWLAALIVTVAYLLIAIILAAVGAHRLSRRSSGGEESTSDTKGHRGDPGTHDGASG